MQTISRSIIHVETLFWKSHVNVSYVIFIIHGDGKNLTFSIHQSSIMRYIIALAWEFFYHITHLRTYQSISYAYVYADLLAHYCKQTS